MAFSLTFRDAIEHARNWLGGIAETRAHTHLVQAVLSAVRELTSVRNWSYLTQTHRLILNPPYTTGTIDYNSSTRVVTLVGGSFPSWAASGDLISGDVVSRVSVRTSATSLTLDSDLKFSGDLTSESYELVQQTYALPEDFVKIDELLLEDNYWAMHYVQPRDWLSEQRYTRNTGPPSHWTIMGHPTSRHRMALYLSNAPASTQTMDFVYTRRVRELNVTGYEADHSAGTISLASGTTITGSGTSFAGDMVGTIIRIGRDNTSTPGPAVGPYPRIVEATIASVESSTSCTIDTTLSSSYSSRKYVVSDPIDIDPGMTEAFLRCLEKNTGIQRRAENIAELEALYQRALQVAEWNDSKTFLPKVVGATQGYYRRLADYPMGDDQP